MSSKLDALLREAKVDLSFTAHRDALEDFGQKHGYIITFRHPHAYYGDEEDNTIIDNALYVSPAEGLASNNNLLTMSPEDVPYNKFLSEGGKFINDIYGVEPDFYVDTPKNRKVILDYMMEHPEKAHQYWYNQEIYDNAAWDDYNDSFKNAKNCHFFAEVKPDSLEESEMISKLCEMTSGEAYDAYGLHRDEVITHTVSFPNDVEIDIKLVIGLDEDDMNWCEAVIFKNGSEIGHTDVEDEYFGPWELEDHDGNKYHIQVSPNQERTKENIKERKDTGR